MCRCTNKASGKVIDDIANAPAVSALEDEGEKAHEN